jgi:hypothetical protein
MSVSSIIYFKLIWIDEMQIITESRIFQWQNIKYDNKYTKNEIVQFSERMFQQTIDIPMGNNFASLLADLFLHAYDADFLWQRHI